MRTADKRVGEASTFEDLVMDGKVILIKQSVKL
jgi:hypothetical protein